VALSLLRLDQLHPSLQGGATRPMTTVIGLRAKNHPARFSFLGTAVERKLADALSGAGLALDPIPPKLASRFIRDDRLALQEDTIAVKGDRLAYRPRRWRRLGWSVTGDITIR
jgi:hypothetical protein